MKGRVGRGPRPNRLEWHSHERPLSPDGTQALLLCDVCGTPKWWPVSTIAYTCRVCWEHYQVGDTRLLCAGCMEWYWVPPADLESELHSRRTVYFGGDGEASRLPGEEMLCRECLIRAYSADREHDGMNPGPFAGAETVADNEVAE